MSLFLDAASSLETTVFCCVRDCRARTVATVERRDHRWACDLAAAPSCLSALLEEIIITIGHYIAILLELLCRMKVALATATTTLKNLVPLASLRHLGHSRENAGRDVGAGVERGQVQPGCPSLNEDIVEPSAGPILKAMGFSPAAGHWIGDFWSAACHIQLETAPLAIQWLPGKTLLNSLLLQENSCQVYMSFFTEEPMLLDHR